MSFRCANAQRGVALVIALLVVAICAVLLVALQRDFDLSYRRAANLFLSTQSIAYLHGAEDMAALALQLDFDADQLRGAPRDDFQEFWAEPSQPFALDEGGWLRGSLNDLQGRFNLNSLGGAARSSEGSGEAGAYTPAQQVFIRLLQALEGLELDQFQATAITESVADWIDEDSEPRLNGAESTFYASQRPSYRPANGPMMSVSELRAVAKVTPAMYRALRPLVTVWPENALRINIHTAPREVLRALNVDDNLQPLSAAEGEELCRQRRETGFESVEEFLQLPQFAGDLNTGVSGLVGETSSYFLLLSRVEIADREQQLYSVLRRQQRQVDVLLRSNASLYDVADSTAETCR